MKRFVILLGPQGAGNHLFGKIFSMSPQVHGWKESLESDGYFIPHCREPFNFYWNNIDQIDERIMGGKDYAVTSISNPYIENWKPKVPPVEEFIAALQKVGIEPQLVVIGRDRNILTEQQTRLRGGPTWGNMIQFLANLNIVPFYISQELLYLYKGKYIQSISQSLNFPLVWEGPLPDEILKQDANEKYIKSAAPTELDAHVKTILDPTKRTRYHPTDL